MLGLVFTEFVEMVEDRFSPEVADDMVEAVGGPHGGAYTAVGYYPHQEIVAMVQALSKRSGVPVPTLVRTFGRHLLGRFAVGHSELFARHDALFGFLAAVDGEIHTHVRKLYDQASLPRFTVLERTEHRMLLLYESTRSMEDLAIGLIEGASDHYGESVRVESSPWVGDERRGTLFTIERD